MPKVKQYMIVEQRLATTINLLKGQKLPDQLPDWMIRNGIIPGAEILSATDIGSNSSKNKTDVLVKLKNSEPLKLSVKMINADYYGNWYGHERICDDFGIDVFNKLSKATTDWANKIKNDPKWENKPFIGVSLCFGKRSGKTKLGFEQILSQQDLLTLVKGEGNGDNVANALIITKDGNIDNINMLISSLQEISVKNILSHMDDFYIIFRPINPMTEGSNRGKNIFTRFVPYKRLKHLTSITVMSELNKLGTYKTVTPVLGKPKLTHNYVLNDLEKNYNIVIPRKK